MEPTPNEAPDAMSVVNEIIRAAACLQSQPQNFDNVVVMLAMIGSDYATAHGLDATEYFREATNEESNQSTTTTADNQASADS